MGSTKPKFSNYMWAWGQGMGRGDGQNPLYNKNVLECIELYVV